MSTREKLYNPLLDGDYYHNDDITVLGNANIRGQQIDRINLIKVDTESAASRNLTYIRENIAMSQRRTDRLNG
jgi:hypothetical protein